MCLILKSLECQEMGPDPQSSNYLIKKGGTIMKRRFLFISGMIFVLAVAWTNNGLCQGCGPFNPWVLIVNAKHHPLYGNGIHFVPYLTATDVTLMKVLKKITASNIDTDSDDTTVYQISLTPDVSGGNCSWSSSGLKFTGQQGIYEFKIEKSNVPLIRCQAGEIPLDPPIPPIPQNLRVTFENGSTKPTLSFDPIDTTQTDFDLYRIRIFDKDYTRRIYSTEIGKFNVPIATFPENRDYTGQTPEDLVPGEKYIFRADIWKILPGNIQLFGNNFKVFEVPKK